MQVVRAATAVGFWKKRLRVQAGQVGIVLLVLAVVKVLLDEFVMPMPVKVSLYGSRAERMRWVFFERSSVGARLSLSSWGPSS